MRRLLAQARTDLTVILRNNFPWIMLIALAATSAAVYLLPREPQPGAPVYVYAAGSGGKLGEALGREVPADRFLDSSQALEEAVRSRRGAVGLLLQPAQEGTAVVLLHTGDMPPRQARLIEAGLLQLRREAEGDSAPPFRTELLAAEEEPIPLNLSLLPVLMVFEVIVLGFLFVAVTVFQEKQDGSIQAFRVSPGSVWTYLLSKTALWMALTMVYGALLLLITRGPRVRWGPLLALLAVSGLFMTLLGLLVSVFFRSISEWFFAGVGILLLNMLPQISYLHPSFSPPWITWIPSYPVLFAVRDLLFRPQASARFAAALARSAAAAAILLPAALLAVHRRLMKEARP